ncbi:TadE/TadG family type IV pilus assembly protein [Anaerovorax sp. IOR16]|uniref:TadE/TadG family type IV pilus assembly protein n=1 Tax=Anaerovorax sp. IOR16 TaxID=2773458 RepID=UPI001FD6FFC8|nr:TadE family protein [Anaerovorax sp. IOR16]
MHIRNEKGQAMVEFALVLPILLLLLCAICEFGSIFSNQILANNACREAVRYAAVHYKDDGLTKVEDETDIIVKNYSSSFDIQISISATEEIKADVSAKVKLLTPVFSFLDDGNGYINLNSQCTMRIE